MSFLLALALTSCIVGVDAPVEDDPGTLAANWGPYDPKPGHPTLDERDAFVAEVSAYAQAAESQYGTPAAAILAMTCNEGGFGFTKTAINANNLFGWKWYSADAAGASESNPIADAIIVSLMRTSPFRPNAR